MSACRHCPAFRPSDQLVYSVPAAIPPGCRFFNDSRRLNVALSRARHLCVIVGSKGTLTRAAYRHDMWNILASYEE